MAYLSADERRRQIIQAAVRVIGREGVAGTTTRRIAEEANANLGTLHYIFSGKEDIFDSVFTYCWEVTSEVFDEVIVDGSGMEAAARAILDRYVVLAVADPVLLAAQYHLLAWSFTTETGREMAQRAYRGMDDLVIGALNRGRGVDEPIENVAAIARMIGSLVDGMCLRYLVSRSQEELHSAVAMAQRTMHEAFVAGLADATA